MNLHFNNEAFECSWCLKQYNSKTGLVGHARKNHPQEVDDIAQDPDDEVMAMIEKSETGWICKMCGRKELH